MIFLVAAVASFVKRPRSITLFDDVRGGSKADIANLSWQEFEALVGEGFRHRGFEVTDVDQRSRNTVSPIMRLSRDLTETRWATE
jgi:hypothetical protein